MSDELINSENILPDNEYQPLWSIMIPTYNCANYLEQTIRSILLQDKGPNYMHIEVVDDCSSKDDPHEVVKKIGNGRVKFYRQPNNAGATENFNTCVRRSKGKFIHILHGDDYVLDNFYEEVESVFNSNKNIGICFTRSLIVDEENNLLSLSPRIKTLEHPSNNIEEILYENPIRTPGVVVRKEVYEKINLFNTNLVHTADWEMWIRAVNFTNGIFINKSLVCYRYFSQNDTSKLMQTGKNLEDYLELSKICKTYIPEMDIEKFKIIVLNNALSQSLQFKKSNNITSYKMNIKVFINIYKTLTLKNKIIQGLKYLINKIKIF